MSVYKLPQIHYSNNFYKGLNPRYCNSEVNTEDTINSKILVNKTLHRYINNLKEQIDDCESRWDKCKKYTNPYEFIHTTIPNTRQSICTYKPLSRSFFKMIEICNLLDILNELPKETCNSFHLAEGPGGFIEAIVKLRKNKTDKYYGMTLLQEENHNVPGWRKSNTFLQENKNVKIETGIDGTGDLMSSNNLIYCFKNYKGQIDLVTGDGGFDFSIHYLTQEIVSASLIICQISFAIAIQKYGGTFVIKMFDTFTKTSLDILYLLSNIYETVYFVKPHTSRHANSEKYIVCKGFRLNDNDRQDLINALYKIIVVLETNNKINCYSVIDSLFSFNLPYYFTNKIEEYNAIFGQQQVENINLTLQLIHCNKYDKLELIKKNNIQKCINWCQEYNMDYTSVFKENNMFLTCKN